MDEWKIRYCALRGGIKVMYEEIVKREIDQGKLGECAVIQAYHNGLMAGIEMMENQYPDTDFDEIEMEVVIANALAKKSMCDIEKIKENNR